MIGGVRVGVSICEDAWSPTGPIAEQAAGGAELVVNINASPYSMDKVRLREKMLATRAADASVRARLREPGRAARTSWSSTARRWCSTPRGELVARAPQFVEDLLVVDLEVDAIYRKRLLDPRGRETQGSALPEVLVSEEQARPPAAPGPIAGAAARTRSARSTTPSSSACGDYIAEERVPRRRARAVGGHRLVAGRRHRRRRASGPSTSTACRCRRATRATARVTDAEALAQALGCDYRTIAIEPAFAAFLDLLAPSFAGRDPDLTEENLQSRIRGMLLMALSNKFGWLVLTTGQQERDGRRLLDPLRRLGRWLRGDQGRLQDDRLQAVPAT